MNAALLTTKLHIPIVHHNLVPRPRLTAKLNECIAHPLTLISAPASESGTVAWYSCYLDDHGEWNGQSGGWDNARWRA